MFSDYLKFLKNGMKKFRFNGTTTTSAASSNYDHPETSLGKLSSGLVAVSGWNSGVEVELFAKNTWSRQPDFPDRYNFNDFSTSTVNDTLYIFGEGRKLISLLTHSVLDCVQRGRTSLGRLFVF